MTWLSLGRLSNSPPPKSAQEQDKGWAAAREWPGWATVEISVLARKSRSIDGPDDRRDTLLTRWSSCPGEAGNPVRITGAGRQKLEPFGMNEEKHSGIKWMDLLWLVFLLGLAVLPPVEERHKQLTLLAIGIVQLAEGRIVATWPRVGLSAVVLVKIVLATLLINHTGELGINSSYYPIYYVPDCDGGDRLWALGHLALDLAGFSGLLLISLSRAAGIHPHSHGRAELAIRIMFFFMAAIVVNRFTLENRRKTQQYQQVAEELTASQSSARAGPG